MTNVYTFFPARPTSQFGYACKTCIAAQLDPLLLGGFYFAWFSTELNPIANGSSSVPLLIYSVLDTAVKRKQITHEKILSVKVELLLTVERVIKPRDLPHARALRHAILSAPVEMFRPQIWRIDLRHVDGSRWKKDRTRPGWDEQYVTDLTATEFEIVVE